MTATDLPWSCRCGAMGGSLTVEGRSGTAALCHCDSCVRAQRHFGVEVTRTEGVALFQTTADRFQIDQGAEHLALARLSPKGSYRWFASCCNTQLGVTPTTPKFAFFSPVQTIFEDTSALGPARTHTFMPQPGGEDKNIRLVPAILAIISRSFAALVTGRWRETPFFDVVSGEPVAKPQILPKEAGRA